MTISVTLTAIVSMELFSAILTRISGNKPETLDFYMQALPYPGAHHLRALVLTGRNILTAELQKRA